MKARLHKGGFEESMETMREIGNSIEDVFNYFKSLIECPFLGVIDCSGQFFKENLSFTKVGVDDRIGWQAPAYIVEVNGWGVIGMVSEEPKKEFIKCKLCRLNDERIKIYGEQKPSEFREFPIFSTKEDQEKFDKYLGETVQFCMCSIINK